jgi:hypothetical protein
MSGESNNVSLTEFQFNVIKQGKNKYLRSNTGNHGKYFST